MFLSSESQNFSRGPAEEVTGCGDESDYNLIKSLI